VVIVVYWVLLVSPNFLNQGDDLFSHLSKFKYGVQVLSTATCHIWSPGSGVIGGVLLSCYNLLPDKELNVYP